MTETLDTTEQRAQGYVGTSVPRREDPELLTGQARFIDDITIPGMVWMAVVRSPYAHARITRVDVSRALDAPGLVAAFSGADLADEWAGPLPMAWPVTEDINNPSHWPLTKDKARFAGDGVAVVVADSRAAAKDAAELVDVEYEPLEVVTDIEAALADGAPVVHDEFGTNRSYTWTLEGPEEGAVERAFAEAPVTITERYRQQRLIPNAIEPRGVIVEPVPAQGEFTMWSSTQIPHIARTTLALTTGIPESKLRVVAPDVGGGFGSKLQVNAEEALCLALARRLGLPVKWIEERSENYLTTHHGRDVIQEIELAATEDGTIRGVRTRLYAAMGAYLQLVTPGIPLLGAWLYGGTYGVEAYGIEIVGVFTNTTPTDAYRGAGRPEATYAIERAVDALARKLDMDPVELRRKNFIKQFPATLASGLTVDSGDYDACLDRALELVGYEDVRQEQGERRARNDSKQIGVGFSTYLEMCGLAPSRILAALRYVAGGWDRATIRCLPTGKVQVLAGTSPHGQGHVTTFAQIVGDQLGVPFEDVEVLHGDTAVVPLGMDTYGSRSLVVGGVAVWNASEKIKEKAKQIAAHELEISADDVEWADGRFQVKGTPDRSKSIAEVAFTAWTAHDLPDGMEPGLEETAVYDPPNFSWPAGAHIAVVEVDTETGHAQLLKYVAVDDVGEVINPTIVDGQIHGGIAQGVAQALYEEAVYDEQGTLMTSSMHSYRIPSAAELPAFTVGRTVTASPGNPMGVKGVGETGAIASTPAVVNAVIDALQPFGITDIEMPLTPERVWRAIGEAKGGAA
jgi:aerobic carbon-monoxide dehydrogenase large subunit